jgi:3-hydroxyisobutyrate dehydrogenase-like beta-hydroxyacid dehydrogenase
MTKEQKKISIIGLGQMGRKLAQLYADGGYDVLVWNRTESKANGLKGVKVAPSVATAIADGDLHIICVLDNTATLDMLNSLPDKSLLKNKTVVNLTTGSPGEAATLEALINRHGGGYLNGAIQVAPDQMGLPGTTILVAGERSVFDDNKIALDILGGNLRYLGDKAAASPAMDLATLTWLYGSYIGLIYGMKLCQEFALKLEDYRDIIAEIVPGFTDFFKHEVNMVSQGTYEVTQSPLSISVSATQRIADTFKGLSVAQEFPEIIASILKQAGARYGSPEKEVAVILKVIGGEE